MKFTFGLSPEELKNQVDNYSTLTVFRSYRGLSAILLLLSVSITAMWVAYSSYDTSAWIDAFVLLIMAYFVYRGSKWAFIAAMIVWTVEKIYAIKINPSTFLIQIVWWFFYILVFHRGWQVEKARSIGSVAPPPPPSLTPPVAN